MELYQVIRQINNKFKIKDWHSVNAEFDNFLASIKKSHDTYIKSHVAHIPMVRTREKIYLICIEQFFVYS